MAHFIRDVRKDFKTPDLPFVIGVIGVDGDKAKGGIANLRPAMAAPAGMPEFKGTVAAVETGQFWDHAMAALMPKRDIVRHRLSAGHVIGENGMMEPREATGPGWEVVGAPEQENRVWQFTAIDPIKDKDKLPKKEKKRLRQIELPAALDEWYTSEFDDHSWQSGKAPIGKGIWKHRNFPEVKSNSTWGEGEFLLMRTTFEIDKLDYAQYRLCVLARQGFNVYLNGEKINTYIWWQDAPFYRAIPLDEKQAKLLKKGRNVLAVYANCEFARKSEEPFGSVDAVIEGISKDGLEYVNSQAYKLKQMDKICTREEGKIILGASNGGYHYLGSAKMLCQIGEAFANAMAKLDR